MVNIPTSTAQCIDKVKRHYREILGDNLRGLYIHGSIAMKCFNPTSSDIDVLVVVQDALDLDTKKRLEDVHLRLACDNPLELSVVLQRYLDNFVHPTPFEFHYGDDFKEAFETGTVDLTTPRSDPDLAAHFVIARHYGVAVVGEPAQSVFPNVPHKAYLDSIAQDARWSYNNVMCGPDEGECAVPRYAVLNSCRILAYLDDTQNVMSKRGGGEWGLEHLPQKYAPVIQEALNEYAVAGSSQPVDAALLKAFVRYAYERIRPHLQDDAS